MSPDSEPEVPEKKFFPALFSWVLWVGVNGAGQQQKVKSIPLDPLEILKWQNLWVSNESLDKQHQHHLEEVILEMHIFTLDKRSETGEWNPAIGL